MTETLVLVAQPKSLISITPHLLLVPGAQPKCPTSITSHLPQQAGPVASVTYRQPAGSLNLRIEQAMRDVHITNAIGATYTMALMMSVALI